jgi:uncharacterized protein YcbK (DUF882 family)
MVPWRSPSRVARRELFKYSAAGALALCAPQVFARSLTAGERRLSFYNLHTGEQLSRVYWAQGGYVDPVLDDINYLLRDFRTGDVKIIDPALLDLLYALRRLLDSTKSFQVISGYRSPQTNAMLRRRGKGVAKHSYHMRGMAIDVRLPGRRLADLRRAAVALKRGGVGYYPDPNFVHVDTGPVRYW